LFENIIFFRTMRIWSLHPRYLDSKGLVALWRETLLAKHVLEGKTKGYIHHPQLKRFKAAQHPVDCLNYYLTAIYEEAEFRGYHFDKTKINQEFQYSILPVTNGQIEYEQKHLLNKLKTRDIDRYHRFVTLGEWSLHPLFYRVEGDVEDWEIR
jgi:hypothetical protein